MLKSYLFPISYAFLTFPIAAFLLTLPILIIQYRKYGYLNKYRAMMLYLFLLYMMNAVYLILLPLPKSIHNEPMQVSSYMQWIPFHFIQDIIRETGVVLDRPATYLQLLKERAVLQVVFNVCLLAPFGMFLRYYFRVKWVKCLAISFGLSLVFELTQLTGIWGIYDYPYRLFDVDDLIMNTAGGMLGYVMSDWLFRHLPRVDRLDEDLDLSTKRVTYTRRAVAYLLDWIILMPAMAVLAFFNVPFPYIVVVVVYFIVIAYMTNGRTFGKWVVRIQLKGRGDRITLGELVVRYGLLYLLVGGLNFFPAWYFLQEGSDMLQLLYMFGLFVFNCFLAVHVLRCLFNHQRQLFYERKSGTTHKIT